MTYFKILTTVYRYLPLHKVEYDFQTFLVYCLADAGMPSVQMLFKKINTGYVAWLVSVY